MRFPQLAADCPTRIRFPIRGGGHGPALLAVVSFGGVQLHAGIRTVHRRPHFDLRQDEISILAPTRPLAGQRRIRQHLQA